MHSHDGDPTLDVAGVRRPCRGERVCGDAWAHVSRDDNVTLLALFDGLGHGEGAAAASQSATEFVRTHAGDGTGAIDLARLLAGLEAALRRTRGAVASLVLIEPQHERLQFAGVGNVEGHVLAAHHLRLVPRFGMLGNGNHRAFPPQVAKFAAGELLVLHTDGIVDIVPSRIPRRRPPVDTAELVLSKWGRPDDDAAVVVARHLGAV